MAIGRARNTAVSHPAIDICEDKFFISHSANHSRRVTTISLMHPSKLKQACLAVHNLVMRGHCREA